MKGRPDRSREWIAALVALTAFAAVALLLQPWLASSVRKVKQRDDVSMLPPPRELRAMTLGYKNATADLLWAKLVLEYGLHWQEKRAFPEITRYIDGILAVEPSFAPLYVFVDTMIVFTPVGAGEDEARVARRYLERGTRERAHDPEVWVHYGQFLAFLAPSFLKDEAEIQQWRKDGALALMHAVELGADPDRSLAASTILNEGGERRAAIQHLQRAYAVADDPETRRQIGLKLQRLEASLDAEQAATVVEHEWRSRYPFLSRGETLLIGPRRSAVACAGPASYDRKGCAKDWTHAIGAAR